jgi:hypothetical protein
MPTRSVARSYLALLPRKSPSRLAPLLVALALAGAAGSRPSKDGPPPGHTGGFGEPTCRACHSEAPLNEPGGELLVAGVPAAYEPGRTYDLEVLLRRAGMLRAGFQLAARFQGEGMFPGGAQAGVLTPVDDRTAVVWDSSTHVAYIEHTLKGGTLSVGDSGRWRFRWTAPVSGGGVIVVHVAANAANDDDSPLGDLIYAAWLRIRRGAGRR